MADKKKAEVKPDELSLGERLRAFRKAQGLTLKQMGDHLGKVASMVSKYETGVHAPGYRELTMYKQLGFQFEENLLEPDEKILTPTEVALLTLRKENKLLLEANEYNSKAIKELFDRVTKLEMYLWKSNSLNYGRQYSSTGDI